MNWGKHTWVCWRRKQPHQKLELLSDQLVTLVQGLYPASVKTPEAKAGRAAITEEQNLKRCSWTCWNKKSCTGWNSFSTKVFKIQDPNPLQLVTPWVPFKTMRLPSLLVYFHLFKNVVVVLDITYQIFIVSHTLRKSVVLRTLYVDKDNILCSEL